MSFFDYYPFLKVVHLISLISFMAGMLYLPRLFVYHSMQKFGSGEAKMLEIMEYRLLKYIINPALIFTLLSGLSLSHIFLKSPDHYWLYLKFACFLGIGYVHMLCCRYRKKFLISTDFHSPKFFRILNEVPTLLMIMMVCAVVFKWF
jgi:putative membrane protein